MLLIFSESVGVVGLIIPNENVDICGTDGTLI